MEKLPESIDGLPDLCGSEPRIRETVLRERDRRVFPAGNGFDFGRVRSAAAIALHMHQPLVPAGGDDLGSAAIISNLKLMMDNPHVGDNHNAPVFRWCYRRMGEFVPQLLHEGHGPRVMLDYSGTLLHGLWAMGLEDVLDSLRNVTCRPAGPGRWPGAIPSPYPWRRRQSEYSIRYTALSFVVPEKVRFKYRLEGLEPDWVDRRAAAFSSLTPSLRKPA